MSKCHPWRGFWNITVLSGEVEIFRLREIVVTLVILKVTSDFFAFSSGDPGIAFLLSHGLEIIFLPPK